MLRKQRRTTYGAFHFNTAQVFIFLIAAVCAYVVYNAYQQAHQPPPVLTLADVSSKPNAREARYITQVKAWQERLAPEQVKVIWPYQGQDFAARIDVPSTALLPKDVMRQFLVHLEKPQDYITPVVGGTPVSNVTRADLNHLLQYLVSTGPVPQKDFALLSFYLQPGKGLSDKLWPDPNAVSKVDIDLLRQCLQTKKPIDVSNFTSQGFPAQLTWDSLTAVFSPYFVQAVKDSYTNYLAARCYLDFVGVRKRAGVTNNITSADSCIVHIFAPSTQPGAPPGTMEEVLLASAAGVSSPPSSGGG